jgi:hypothetical protein
MDRVKVERDRLYSWLVKALLNQSDWTEEEIKGYVDVKLREATPDETESIHRTKDDRP